MEFGETVGEAAEREAREETRLTATFDRVKGVVNETLVEAGRVVAHFVLFVCRLEADGSDHVESEEGELRWFTPEDIREHEAEIIPTDLRMIRTMLLRPGEHMPFAEASMRQDEARYVVLRFDVQ